MLRILKLTVILCLVSVLMEMPVHAQNIRPGSETENMVLSAVSLFYRFTVFCSGIFDVTTLIYDVSVAALFLFLTWQVMEKRRRA